MALSGEAGGFRGFGAVHLSEVPSQSFSQFISSAELAGKRANLPSDGRVSNVGNLFSNSKESYPTCASIHTLTANSIHQVRS